MVRALRSHRRGRWFESNHIHHKIKPAVFGGCFYFVVSLFNVNLWRDSMQMRPPSNQNIVLMGCVNRAMVANRCISCLCRCQCILHNDATNTFDLKFCLCRWYILQQRFGSWHRFGPILWMTRPDMHLQKMRLL